MRNFVQKMATKVTKGQICDASISIFDCDMIFYFCAKFGAFYAQMLHNFQLNRYTVYNSW